MRKGNMPSLINQNDFKGQKQIQDWNNRQIYTKGFSFNSQANTTNEESINLGGKARFLHGICFYSDFNFAGDRDLLSLVINSEQLIDNVIWWNYNPQGQTGNIFKTNQFFALPRPLSGADSVQLILKTLNAHPYDIVFFLSDK